MPVLDFRSSNEYAPPVFSMTEVLYKYCKPEVFRLRGNWTRSPPEIFRFHDATGRKRTASRDESGHRPLILASCEGAISGFQRSEREREHLGF